ncbi:MAG TPA: N-formylglutamate amidohydrolase, partial [Steroidobacteraceae bacterium]|nr:N-formylglutamate amidohydrolase [Steroidobacteraceae bacterium]
MNNRLLAADEPAAVFELRRGGASPFVIVVDHASARIPKRLGTLGLAPSDLERHIAWDIGALAVAQNVATALDAPLVAQNYSRLVIDCNRRPEAATSIPVVSEATEIPGNAGLTAEEIEVRRREIFEPYHDHLRVLLDERAGRGHSTVLVAQHSMTDVFRGARREMHAAILYNRERRFARRVLQALRREPGLIVAENRPYALSDATDYTVPYHAE